VKYEESDSPKSCHDFSNRGAFLHPELLNFLPTKSCHGCKNRGTILTASGPEISFSKGAFSAISRVKFKPLIRFQCRFRLRAPDT